MRNLRLKLAVVPLAVAGALALGPAAPGAGADAIEVLDDYCSQTGDVCLTAFQFKRKTRLQIAIERVSGDYELCVRGPKRRRCKEFELRAGDEGIYSDRVNMRREFGRQGSGKYRAVWKLDGDRVGKPLRFKLG